MKFRTAPKPGATGFAMSVTPCQECLNKAVAEGAFCRPDKCWHKLEIASTLNRWDPTGKHHVRVDAGHIKFNLWGWRYVADSPRHVKRTLLLFDKKRYDEIRIRNYTLRCRRTTRIMPLTDERKEQINQARYKRIAAGKPDRSYPSMRDRVVGFSGIV
jgi:hypothetical protein